MQVLYRLENFRVLSGVFLLVLVFLLPDISTAKNDVSPFNKTQSAQSSVSANSENKTKPFLLSSVLGAATKFLVSKGIMVETSESILTRGLGYLEKGENEKARDEFEKIVAKEPKNADVHYYLGLVYSKLDKQEKAIELFNKALLLNSELKDVYLSLGIAYFKNKDYVAAYEALNEALLADPDNSSANFFMGLTLVTQEKFEDSLRFFNQAKKADKEFKQLGLYYKGLAYFSMGKSDYAKELLTRTVAYNPNTETAKKSQTLIKSIDDRQKAANQRLRINANVGWEWNDNVTRVEQDTVSNITDTSFIFQAGLDYKFIKKKKFTLSGGYNIYQSVFDDAKEFNFQSHTGNLAAAYDLGGKNLRLDYSYTYGFLDKRSFIAIQTLSPSIGVSFHPKQYLSASYRYQDKLFFTDSNRDGINHSVGFLNFLFFLDNKAYWSTGYRFSDENTNGPQFDFAGHLADMTFKFPSFFNGNVRFFYEYRIRDYKNITPSIAEERLDKKQTFQVKYSHPLYKEFTLDLNYKHIKADSNLRSVDYKENVVFVGLGIHPLIETIFESVKGVQNLINLY